MTRYWLWCTNEKAASTISCGGQTGPQRSLFCLLSPSHQALVRRFQSASIGSDGARLLCAYPRVHFLRKSNCRSVLSIHGVAATMMKDIEHFLEDSPHRDIKLNEVFNKISDILQQQTVVAPTKQKMSCDVIETILPEKSNIPINQGLVSEDIEDNAACQALAVRLEEQLRAAKTAQLACGEVLLPADLLPRVARDVLRMAENEPCGLRGCTLYVNFESEQECRKIGTVKCDPNTVSTFELFLTLRRDSRSTWSSLIPQFIKNFTKGGTIMISPGFTLEKKKLYRSFSTE